MKSNSTPKPKKEPLQETEASHSSYGTQPFLSNHAIPIKKNLNITIAGTITAQTAELVQRYGLAVKEHVVSYTGIDNERGIQLKKGLKGISKSKINPQTAKQNVAQQAGFSAEIKETARENVQKIINKDTTRISRTDDIGSVNDPLYDHVELDGNNQIIPNSGTQMKFVGKNPTDCLKKLMSSKYKKYRDANVPFEVPSDFYDGIHDEINHQITALEKQLQKIKTVDKIDVAQKKQIQIDELKKIKQTLKKSKVSKSEAIDARCHPRVSTFKDIARISHKAGLKGAQYGFITGGTIIGIQTMIGVFQGKQQPSDALKATLSTTTKAAATGYITTCGSTALTGIMKNSSECFVRTLSKTGLPTTAISTAMTSINTVWQYLNGKITGTQCLEQMGQDGASIMMSTSYAAVGQVVIPIPVIGGLIGGMIGYALTSSCYSGLMQTLKEAELAHKDRLRMETDCKAAVKAIQEYRIEINRVLNEYLTEYQATFDTAFTDIKTALQIGDADGFISNINHITRKLNGKPVFDTINEFEIRMADPTILKI